MSVGIRTNKLSGWSLSSRIAGPLLVASALLWALPVWAQLSVSDGYVRGLPPGQTVTSAYLTLSNSGDGKLAVLQVTTPAAQSVEFHSHQHRDGIMMMRREDALLVPPRGELSLEPGKLHLMLFGLKRQLRDGQLIPLRLCGEGFPCIDIELPVVSVLSGS